MTENNSQVTILIADDDRTLLESCASILEIQGHEVTLSARGQEALDLLRRRRFDLALIDLYMLDVSGMELLRASVKANPDLIPIIITGKPSVDGLSALDILWGYHLAADSFRGREYVRIDGMEIVVRVGLDASKKRFSYDAIMGNAEIRKLVVRRRPGP